MKWIIRFLKRIFDGRGISFFGGVYHERKLGKTCTDLDLSDYVKDKEIKNAFRFM